MRRADRLFRLIQLLRHRRLTTAAQLAEQLEVSTRTVYRDVRDLVASGVPIEGEAGIGYQLSKRFELPPMMFGLDEIQALVLGARMVESWADDELRQAARSVLAKVEAVLPPSQRHRVRDTSLFSLSFYVPEAMRRFLAPLRNAAHDRKVVVLQYQDAKGRSSERRVKPLGLYFWGRTWTLGGWCELRQDFRNFRLDRIDDVGVTDEIFAHEDPVTLERFIAAMNHDHG